MRSNDMAPTSTINNLANVTALQSEIVGYGLSRFAILGTLTYLANKIVGKSSKWMSFTFLHAVRFHIFDISIMCIPTQIFETVVTSVAVVVTSLHSWWTRANESGKDNAMDMHGVLLSEGVNKNHDLPTILVVGARFEFAPSVCVSPLVLVARQDVSVWMGTVTGKIWYRLTMFWQCWNSCVVHSIHYITQGPKAQLCAI